MYAKRFYRRRPRKYLRRRKTVGKRRSAVSGKIRRYVKRAIHSTLENKERVNYGANQTIQTGSSATMTWPLLIAIDQGITNGQRIGNQIKITKALFKMCINLKPYDATTNNLAQPTWVKMWVVRDLRNSGQTGTLDPTTFSNFFRSNNTGLPFQNNTLDMVFDVNKDYLRVLYSRCFKLGASGVGTANFPVNSTSYFDGSPFARQFTINYGKFARKQLKFNETSTYCNNDNLYLVIQAVCADGTASMDKQLVEFHYCNQMHYEDA